MRTANLFIQKLGQGFIMILSVIALVLFTSLSSKDVNAEQTITLASDGSSLYNILLSARSTPAEKFASEELQRYLNQITQAKFAFSANTKTPTLIACNAARLKVIAPQIKIPRLKEEDFTITRSENSIFLVGGSDRATLYAVYDFLGQAGCQWMAPDFNFFEGRDQFVPDKPTLTYTYTEKNIRQPVLRYRKLYVEEGLTHTTENLRKLIDWMPKARFNVLVIPINYEGHGRVQWDNWREELTPELNKRGIIIEVGGHGYQNFLNAEMQNGKIFKDNPEWFGLDENRDRSRDPHRVFCTSNHGAVSYLQNQVLDYLLHHPEIEIFDFWPPDSEQWCTCDRCVALGSPTERHALLVSQTAQFLKTRKPDVKLECIAYSRYVEPPVKESFNKNVLIDFCPIRQNYDHPIYSDSSSNNKSYNHALLGWLKRFDGDISLYSYYRKYAWRSLPAIIPHYMQNDIRYYQSIGVKGVSVYSEPGDWFTYGINHYVLGQLAWNPNVNVDSLIASYCSIVYGDASGVAARVYTDLENVVRQGCDIPNALPKTAAQYTAFGATLDKDREHLLASTKRLSNESTICNHLGRLDLMVQYASKSVAVVKAKTQDDQQQLARHNEEIKTLITGNTSSGVFISRYKNEQKKPKPNIILIVADDLGYGDLSCYGATKISTPAIDKIASEGMSFSNMYVSSSLCSPSRYSIMTGRYPWRTRLKYGVLTYFEKPLIQKDETTIASMLQRNGYHTACVGKWHLGLDWQVNEKAPANPEESVFKSSAENLQDYIDFSKKVGNGPVTRGFDYFFGMAGSNNMQPYVLIENDSVLQPPSIKQLPYDHYVNALRAPDWDIKNLNQDLTHKAVDVINDHFARHATEPLFLYFPTSAPHRPCLPTFTKGQSKAGLRGDMVQELDWTVNEIVEALKKNKAYENTVLIFTSDNGPRPGDPAIWMEQYANGDYEDYHQSYFDDYKPEYIDANGNKIWKGGWFTYGHNASGNLLGFKSDAWEGGFKVPFIIHWPGHVEKGATNDNMICSADLLATFAELIGDNLNTDEGPDSYSFLSNIMNKNAAPVRTSMVLTAGASGAFVGIRNNWKYIEAAVPGRWPETYYPEGPSKLDPQLYNLSVDIGEQNNLYSKDPKKVQELIDLINTVKRATGTEGKK